MSDKVPFFAPLRAWRSGAELPQNKREWLEFLGVCALAATPLVLIVPFGESAPVWLGAVVLLLSLVTAFVVQSRLLARWKARRANGDEARSGDVAE